MDENEISGAVVDACVKIHRILGPGLLESVYEAVLAFELEKRGIIIQRLKVSSSFARCTRNRC